MRKLMILWIVLSFMPLAVLGHDVYLAYKAAQASHVALGQKPLKISDLGWLWVKYSPDTYDMARDMFEPDTWKNTIEPLLTQTAMVVTGIPAAIVFAIWLVLKLVTGMPFIGGMIRIRSSDSRSGKSLIATKGLDKSKGRTRYKRK